MGLTISEEVLGVLKMNSMELVGDPGQQQTSPAQAAPEVQADMNSWSLTRLAHSKSSTAGLYVTNISFSDTMSMIEVDFMLFPWDVGSS